MKRTKLDPVRRDLPYVLAACLAPILKAWEREPLKAVFAERRAQAHRRR